MAKLTSQNSSKPTGAKIKTTDGEKKPRNLGKKAAFAAKKISPLAAKENIDPEATEELHVSVVSTNGHSGLAAKLVSADPALDLQERAVEQLRARTGTLLAASRKTHWVYFCHCSCWGILSRCGNTQSCSSIKRT